MTLDLATQARLDRRISQELVWALPNGASGATLMLSFGPSSATFDVTVDGGRGVAISGGLAAACAETAAAHRQSGEAPRAIEYRASWNGSTWSVKGRVIWE